jgi:hypothetical protein
MLTINLGIVNGIYPWPSFCFAYTKDDSLSLMA